MHGGTKVSQKRNKQKLRRKLSLEILRKRGKNSKINQKRVASLQTLIAVQPISTLNPSQPGKRAVHSQIKNPQNNHAGNVLSYFCKTNQIPNFNLDKR